MKFSMKVILALSALSAISAQNCAGCIKQGRGCTSSPNDCCEGFECQGFNFMKRCQPKLSCMKELYACNPDASAGATGCCDSMVCADIGNGMGECRLPTPTAKASSSTTQASTPGGRMCASSLSFDNGVTKGEFRGSLGEAPIAFKFYGSPGTQVVDKSASLPSYVAFKEHLRGTFTTDFARPLKNLELTAVSIAENTIIGNFEVTLVDGTVATNLDFATGPTLTDTIGGSTRLFHSGSRSDGTIALLPPDNSTWGEQGGADITFPLLSDSYILAHGGVTSMSFTILEGARYLDGFISVCAEEGPATTVN